MASVKYWLWLTCLRPMPPAQALAVLRHFGSPEGAYFSDPGEYELMEGVSPAVRRALTQKSLEDAERVLEQCERLGVSLLTLQDAQYPYCLKNIPDPPVLLYYKGKLPSFDDTPAVGVVGARSCTPYGEKVAMKLGLDLARAGAVLVSGIAQGIDSAGIRGALAGGGVVVSVLGGGIDVKYPPASRYLYDDVAAAGALVTEYPPGTPAAGEHFPVRNRIISGLSDGVVAVECALKSGTMRTMSLALEQSRDVFAIPGPVDAPMSVGTNRLIRDSYAKLVVDARDILTEYEARYPQLKVRRPLEPAEEAQRLSAAGRSQVEKRSEPSGGEKKEVDKKQELAYIDWKSVRELFSDDEQRVLMALEDRPKLADELIEQLQLPVSRVLSTLTVLQVRGYVEEEPGRRFRAAAVLGKK